MIINKHHHYEHLENFLSKKFSASPSNTTYTYGGVGKIYQGEPDISWKSIVIVKDVGWFCTHGKIYDISGKTSSLKNPVKINGTNFDGSENITTESWGTKRNIYVRDYSNKNLAGPFPIDGSKDITLHLPYIIDAGVTKDSEERVIKDTYSTKEELRKAIDKLISFSVYAGEDDNPPTSTNPDPEKLNEGDYYVTSEGRIFKWTNGEWKNITDFYLYTCMSEVEDIKKKVDISEKWDKTQTSVEVGEIYVRGNKETRPYLDILCCPGFVNYNLVYDTNIYLPFSYGGSWTRTITKYFREPRLVRAIDLSRVSGKTIVITNEDQSQGSVNLILGNSPYSDGNLFLSPGQVCILQFKAGMYSDSLAFYWEILGAGNIGLTGDWV